MIWRIIAGIVLLVSACAFPVILTVLFGVLFLIVFKRYYEIIPIFFVNDMIYGVVQTHVWIFGYRMTMFAIGLVLLSIFFRKFIFEGSFLRA